MNTVKCPVCGGKMVRNGRTAAGSQRWLCKSCRATSTHRIDNEAKLLRTFLGWLFSSRTQAEGPWSARTFRRKCARFWSVWPIPQPTGEVHRVVFVDGIRIAKNVHILIASTDEDVLGWYLARSENSRAWSALMAPTPEPDMVVTDGGSGFEKARKRTWPGARVQRCVFHAFGQVKKQTTTRPNLPAGVELYGLARGLLHVRDAGAAAAWLAGYSDWCSRWEDFLAGETINEETGKKEFTHARLVTARNGLNTLIRRGHPFTFLDPTLTGDGPLPGTNNRIEGGVNAPIREVLRLHRGMSALRRAKAAFWWCYMHSPDPMPPAEILGTMPTDDDIAELYHRAAFEPQKKEGPAQWGDGLVWSELHHSAKWRTDWD
ncbi:IS1249 family transposase [Curtanaerobium respiraculi]|uniref:IS1249 family transposase n=1 Tax=Curtanaerobium respiraculi TaxID=2949669 RepID=UPI0024B32601|nr:IS1249 family transposase [Curtanaerobium respiraculi]